MTFDRKKLFAGMKDAFGKLDGVQQSVIAAVVDKFEERGLTDMRWLAYMLATARGECNFKPVREIGKGKGRPYGKPDKATGQTYYGRGLVQLTWKRNYKLMGERLNLDLVNDPDLALTIPVAVAIMFDGMIGGLFTGKKLVDYFNGVIDKPEAARKIINGTDKAAQFAKWHRLILAALQKAKRPGASVQPKPAEAKTDATVGQETPIPGKATETAIATGGAAAAGWAWQSGVALNFIIAIALATAGAAIIIWWLKRR